MLLLILAICLCTNACSACKFDFGDNDKDEDKDKKDWTLKIVPIGDDQMHGDCTFLRFKLVLEGNDWYYCKNENVQLEVSTSNDTALEIQHKASGYPEVYKTVTNKQVKLEYLYNGREEMLKVYVKPAFEATDIGKVNIEVKILYDGKPLDNADSKHTFSWEPLNAVTKEIFKAIEDGNLNTVINKVNSGGVQIPHNAHNTSGKTFLFAAAAAYDLKKYSSDQYFNLISTLLKIPKIDVNNQCDGYTFSTKFFLEDQIHQVLVEPRVIELLIDKQARVKESTTEIHICLERLYAFTSVQFQKLDLLLQKFSGKVNTKNDDGATPLHIAVSKVSHENITAINKLTTKGADWTIKNNQGASAKEVAKAAAQKFCKEKNIKDEGSGSGPYWDLYKAFKAACVL